MASTTLFPEYLKKFTTQEYEQRLAPKKVKGEKLPLGYGKKQIDERWKIIVSKNEKYATWVKEHDSKLSVHGIHEKDVKDEILDSDSFERSDVYKNNIENYIGTVKVPVGIAGPVQVNGMHAQGLYFIPLATTEAALVASIARGISAINQSGGATAVTVTTATNRDPCFQFKSVGDLGQFIVWANENESKFKEVAESTTRFGKLKEIQYVLEGRDVHMRCQYDTGDASGQNMVTLATEKLVEWIKANTPITPSAVFLEGNMSGDKKASVCYQQSVRGRKVIVECVLTKEVCKKTLHTTPEQIAKNSLVGIRGLALNGSISMNLHLSNAYTALSLATGQDPACAAEVIGIGRVEVTDDGDLYCSMTLPTLLCATVGGGTKLPSQLACLKLMGLAGNGNANAFAEVMATVMLAGEVSLGAAISSEDFAKAHKLLARGVDTTQILETDSLDDRFMKSQALLVKVENMPSKEDILKVYGLYKQATVGDINISKPALFSFDLKGKAKYSAWKKLKGLTKEDAKQQYVDLVLSIHKSDQEKKAYTKK